MRKTITESHLGALQLLVVAVVAVAVVAAVVMTAGPAGPVKAQTAWHNKTKRKRRPKVAVGKGVNCGQ